LRGIAFALCLLLPAPLLAASAIAVPYLSGPVVDEAQLLSPEERAQVQQMVDTLNASGKVQMAVLIASSLQDNDIESYSIAVAEKWKLGKKKTDDGLIFLIAPHERQMRFEVGYGLEGDLTDALTKRILDEVVGPYFKAGRYRDGILLGIEAIAHKLGVDLNAPVDQRLTEHRGGGSIPLLFGLLIFVLFSFLAGFSPTRRRYPGGWGGGGFGGWGGGGGFGGGGFGGGGGFSGGGGGFGGGGSSSSW
jgi:uncharacterized protein